jgi:hypothetical protein
MSVTSSTPSGFAKVAGLGAKVEAKTGPEWGRAVRAERRTKAKQIGDLQSPGIWNILPRLGVIPANSRSVTLDLGIIPAALGMIPGGL